MEEIEKEIRKLYNLKHTNDNVKHTNDKHTIEEIIKKDLDEYRNKIDIEHSVDVKVEKYGEKRLFELMQKYKVGDLKIANSNFDYFAYIYQNINYKTISPLITGLIIALFTYYIYAYMNKLYAMFDDKNIQMTTIGASFLISNISSSIVSSISQLIDKVINNMVYSNQDRILAIKEEITKDYNKKKSELPERNIIIINNILSNTAKYFDKYHKSDEKNYDLVYEYINGVYPRIYDNLMCFPMKAKSLMDIDDVQINTFIGKLPKENHDQMREFLLNIKDNSCIDKVNQRSILYLYGPPGTGKTVFVSNLSKLLNLPVKLINLNKYNSTKFSVEEITGEDSHHAEYIYHANEHIEKGITKYEMYGVIGSTIIENQMLNPIIFMDEASEHLQKSSKLITYFKDILNPDKHSIELSACDGLRIDISKTIMIFAGNQEIDDTIKQRVIQINFTKLGIAEKYNALMTSFANAINKLKLLKIDTYVITMHVIKYIPYILDKDMKICPGGRIIKSVVDSVVQYIRILINYKIEISQDVMIKYIDMLFDRKITASEKIEKNKNNENNKSNEKIENNDIIESKS